MYSNSGAAGMMHGLFPDYWWDKDAASRQSQPQGPINAMAAPQTADIMPDETPSQGGGGMGAMPMPGMLSNIMGGGGASGAGGAGGAAGGASGSSGMGGLMSGIFSNPITGIVGAAAAGATSLSADSEAAGNGGNWEKWLGPLYNIPSAIAEGDWDKAMSDGAMGPVGAVYNIANGKDPLKSFANSLGPAGQVPALLMQGELPYSGGKSSKRYINAFTGAGI